MRFLKLFLFLFLTLFLVRGWYKLTEGFRVAKILPAIEIFSRWEERFAIDLDPKIREILGDPFTYLGRGQQCYAFQSRDGNYVLKCFRLHKYRKPFWSFFYKNNRSLKERQHNWEETLKSLEIAQNRLKEETGLIYLHVSSTKNLPLLTLIDRLGRKSLIDSNELLFLLQVKVDPLLPHLAQWRKEPEKLRFFIQEYVNTVKKRADKKIRNKNRNILKNLGLYQGRVIEFDVGEFRDKPDLADPEKRALEVIKSTKRLRKWLVENAPEALSFLEQQIEAL